MVVFLVFLVVSCGKKETTSTEKGGARKGGKPLALSAVIAKPSKLASSVRGLATVVAGESVEIKTEVAGRIQQIYFREGGAVSQGTLLVKIADTDLQASRAKAKAKLDFAQASHERKSQQLDIQAISKQDLEQSAADLASAKADLAILDAQIAKTEIRAPFAGKVGFQRVSVGAVLSAGQVLTTLVQIHPVKLEFTVPGEHAALAVHGAKVEFDYQDFIGDAVIYATEGALDAGTRSLAVRAKVQGKMPGLVPGATVPFRLVGKGEEGLMVPPDALAGNAKGVILYLLRAGKAQPQPVELGLRTAEHVWIRKGLQEGDTVLCVGAASVRPGAPVELLGIR